MASEGPNSAGTTADDATIGTLAWSNTDNIKLSNNTYATAGTSGGGFTRFETIQDNEVKLVLSTGSIGTENKATGTNWPTAGDPNTYITYGGATDDWSETMTGSDVNNSNFGVVIAADDDTGVSSHYLKVTNFGFSVPATDTIDGIVVEIERWSDPAPMGWPVAKVDHIRITVYHTPIPVVTTPTTTPSSAFPRMPKSFIQAIEDEKEPVPKPPTVINKRFVVRTRNELRDFY